MENKRAILYLLFWSGWLRSPAGAFLGPGRLGFISGTGAASDRMAGLPAEVACSDWAVACGGQWTPRILC